MKERFLQADRPTLPALVDELQYHVRNIARSAYRGDADARAWLLSSFPGHDIALRRLWERTERIGAVKTQCSREV